MQHHIRTFDFDIGDHDHELKIVHSSAVSFSRLQRRTNIKFVVQSFEQKPQVQLVVSASFPNIAVNTTQTTTYGRMKLMIEEKASNVDPIWRLDPNQQLFLQTDITIRLPEVKTLSLLDVESLGSLTLETDFSCPMFQEISLKSINGNISCERILNTGFRFDPPKYGSLSARTVNGSIRGEFHFWDFCTLQSTNGAIDSMVRQLQHDPPTNKGFIATTTNGAISGEFHFWKSCNLTTTNSRIDSSVTKLRHDGPTNKDFTATTTNGAIQGEFHVRDSCILRTTNSPIDVLVKRMRCNRLGDQNKLEASSSNGSIRVRIEEIVYPSFAEWACLDPNPNSKSQIGSWIGHQTNYWDGSTSPYEGFTAALSTSNQDINLTLPYEWKNFQNYSMTTRNGRAKVWFSDPMNWEPPEPVREPNNGEEEPRDILEDTSDSEEEPCNTPEDSSDSWEDSSDTVEESSDSPEERSITVDESCDMMQGLSEMSSTIADAFKTMADHFDISMGEITDWYCEDDDRFPLLSTPSREQ